MKEGRLEGEGVEKRGRDRSRKIREGREERKGEGRHEGGKLSGREEMLEEEAERKTREEKRGA